MSSIIQELRRRNVLRVGAAYLVFSWLVLQFVDVVFPMLGLDDEVLGRPILILLVIGLPIALVLAWVFEITPEGIKRDRDVDRADPNAAVHSGRLDRAIIVVLLAAVGLLLADRFNVFDGDDADVVATVEAKSVAVLPFVNQSQNEDDAFFADGLTETLLHMLAQIPELKVPARTSVFAFRDKQASVQEIANSLGVETVLEGSVRRSGDQIRITAQLVQADTGFTLWSKTFDKTYEDIFAVQDEIATSVTGALQVTLLGSEKPNLIGVGTDNLFAYEKYLQGLEQKNIASYRSLPIAEGLFKEAISADPSFVEAKIDLALSYQLQGETGLITVLDAADQALALLDQVLREEPDNSRALAHHAIIDWQRAFQSRGPTDESTIAAGNALVETAEKAPNQPAIFGSLALASLAAGNAAESLDWLEKGLSIDPLSARLNLQKGRLLLTFLNRPADAQRAFAKARESAPGWTAVALASGDAAFAQQKFREGMRWYVEAMEMDPQDHEIPAMIGSHLYNFGIDTVAEDMLVRAQAIAPNAPYTQALQLEKHIRSGNDERVVNLASQLLADDIEDRGSAFSLSVFGYVSAMINLDTAAKVPEFFESLRPGITESEYQLTGTKEFSMRFALVHALNNVGDFSLSQSIMSDLQDWADLAIPGWRQNDYVMVNTFIASGDIEGAVPYAISDLSRPLGQQMRWRTNYEYFTWMDPLLDVPEVEREIARLDARTDEAAEGIAELFAKR